MDAITLKRIEEAHPRLRAKMRADYIEADKLLGQFVRLRFSHVYRSPELQRQLFLQRPKVTNSDSWQSIHNYGLAFDIVLLVDKDRNGTFESVSWDMVKDFDLDKTPDWSEVTRFFLSKGYTNGFISRGKKWDFPHFQYDYGFNWRVLKQRIDRGITIKDDNGITYPKI